MGRSEQKKGRETRTKRKRGVGTCLTFPPAPVPRRKNEFTQHCQIVCLKLDADADLFTNASLWQNDSNVQDSNTTEAPYRVCSIWVLYLMLRCRNYQLLLWCWYRRS